MANIVQSLLLAAVCAAAAAEAEAQETTLVEEPADVLVTEGDEAVLKCKTSGEATRCKWLLNRTDNPYELVDVKEFYPKRDGDCSIRIKKVRATHVGRWVCSVFISLLHDQLVSRPAAVAIATLSTRSRHVAIAAHPANATAEPGREVALECRTDSKADSCGWAMPDDVVITLSRQTMSLLDEVPLSFQGDLARGDCSIRIDDMQERFAGRWSCFFSSEGHTVWTSPAHLYMEPAAHARTGSLASVNPAVVAVLALGIVGVMVAVICAVIYRRRTQLRHAKLLENPLYGIKNLQMAAAASAAQRKAKQTHLAPPAARSIEELGVSQRAPPNDYYSKDTLQHEKEKAAAHVYDTPRKGTLYDVPTSKESYQVPRSSYEIPPPPVKLDFEPAKLPDVEDNLYEEVKPVLFRDEDMDGYLIPEKMEL